jgi:hypothetical protein
LSAAAIAGAVSAHSVQGASIGLANTVTVAVVNGTNVTISTLTISKMTLKIMAWTKFKTAAAGVATALLVTGAATILMRTVLAQNNAGKESTKPAAFTQAGYATPEAAYKTLLWEMSTGNLERTLAACTPERAEGLKAKLQGKSDEEIRRLLIEEANHRVAYQLTQEEVVSESRVRLHLLVQPYPGHPRTGNDVQEMQKIGNQWKYAGKYGVDIKE